MTTLNLRIPDNSKETITDYDETFLTDLKLIANKTIAEMAAENKDFLIFPQKLTNHVKKQKLFSLIGSKLKSGNMMGFVGRNNTQLTITSRFAQADTNDYFLHYMLQKVFLSNTVNLDQSTDKKVCGIFYSIFFLCILKKRIRKVYTKRINGKHTTMQM